MKRIGIFIFSLFTIFMFTGCSDMFETDSDRQIFDPELNAKTDSMFYTLGILKGLQQVGDQHVLMNEMRGDLVATNSYTETDLKALATFTADATNKYDSAYLYYRVINNCNYYIAHRDTTLLTGSRKVAIPEYAEALAVRAWTYMQLAKTYGKVPFYTDPLTSIGDANSNFEEKDLQGICDALAPGLIQYSGTQVPTYGNISAGVLNSSTTESQTEKSVVSRLAMLPIDLVLGDLYLETHQYELAARYYFKYLADKGEVLKEAFILSSSLLNTLGTKLPSSMYIDQRSSSAFQWPSIFSIASTNDIISYIPLAANKLRGVTTNLPGIFGYDFYSTTGGTASSSERYLLERQIDASASYLALSNAQEYYYLSAKPTGPSDVHASDVGDLRRYITMNQTTKGDSTFAVMIKFNNANIPVYRTATVYLRLAEAINRMGYSDAAFAILKDGINEDLLSYVITGNDSTDHADKNYIRKQTETFLKSTFLSDANKSKFTDNWGIHSRGTYYTKGSFSPYQMDTVVAKKIAELQTVYGITPTGTYNDTINAVEDLICDEMALELAFEGTRFNDLTRIAKHKNNAALYSSDFGTRWMAKKLAYKADGLEQRLLDEQNWYLPFK